MASDTKRVKLFLSSPSDLADERETIRRACEDLSHDLGGIEGFFIELIRWETHTFSAIGQSPQDIINEQIGQDYDIFLGMLGLRFGTETRSYGSGTEEEFNLAVARNRETGAPEVMFFFFNGRADLGSIDGSQLSKVQNFKSALSGKGILYSSFEDRFSLYRLAHSQIQKVVKQVLQKTAIAGELTTEDRTPQSIDPLGEWQKLLQEDSEVNASVLMQAATQATSKLVGELEQINRSTNGLIKSLGQETIEIGKSAASFQPQRTLKAINRAVESVRLTNQRYLEIIPNFHENLVSAISNSQRSIAVFDARGELNEEAASLLILPLTNFRHSLESLSLVMEKTESSLAKDFQLGTPFSVEIRKLRALLTDMKRVLEGGARELGNLEATLTMRIKESS